MPSSSEVLISILCLSKYSRNPKMKEKQTVCVRVRARSDSSG